MSHFNQNLANVYDVMHFWTYPYVLIPERRDRPEIGKPSWLHQCMYLVLKGVVDKLWHRLECCMKKRIQCS